MIRTNKIALILFVFVCGAAIGHDFNGNAMLIPIMALCTTIFYGGVEA